MRGTILKDGDIWKVEVWKDLNVTEYPIDPYLEKYYFLDNSNIGDEVEFEVEDFWEHGMEKVIKVAKLSRKITEPIVSDDFQIGPHGAFEMTEEVIEQRMQKIQGLHALAKDRWEGCDGCTKEDANLWRNGFISGALELEPEWIDWDEVCAQYKGVSDLHDFIEWAKQNFNITKKD